MRHGTYDIGMLRRESAASGGKSGASGRGLRVTVQGRGSRACDLGGWRRLVEAWLAEALTLRPPSSRQGLEEWGWYLVFGLKGVSLATRRRKEERQKRA